MSRPRGGYIGFDRTVTESAASGVWTLAEVERQRRIGTWPTSAATDQDFFAVALLLHMDGSNGSTTFTDSSGSPKTVTRQGGGQISTTQSKFGGSSGSFDGTGDYLTASGAGLAVGSGNFTIEGWFYFNSLQSGIRTLWAHRSSNDGIGGALLTHVSGDVRLYISNSTGTGWQVLDFDPNLTVSTSTWHHIAMVRDGNTIRTFVDGAAGTLTTVSAGAIGTSGNMSIMAGAADGTQEVDGYCDEFRLTVGVARYTAGFTAPTAAFPDS
jgi:hypothetical protein